MWRGEPDSHGSTWEFNLRSLVKITKLKIEKLQQRRRRGNDPLPKNDAHTRFIDEIGSAIAKALRWNLNIMDRIALSIIFKFHLKALAIAEPISSMNRV